MVDNIWKVPWSIGERIGARENETVGEVNGPNHLPPVG